MFCVWLFNLGQQGQQNYKLSRIRGEKGRYYSEHGGGRILAELVPTSKQIQFQHNDEALQALKEQKVDAFWQLDVFVFYVAEKDKSLKVANLQPIHPSTIGLGVRKGDKEWRDFVDIGLLEMMTSGEYRKLLDKWFGRVRGEFLELALRREIKSKE
jgi:ABC-type amino acid transport substrate-binding protein